MTDLHVVPGDFGKLSNSTASIADDLCSATVADALSGLSSAMPGASSPSAAAEAGANIEERSKATANLLSRFSDAAMSTQNSFNATENSITNGFSGNTVEPPAYSEPARATDGGTGGDTAVHTVK